MRPGEIDDSFMEKVQGEFKRQRNLSVDLDATSMIVDILTEWMNDPKKQAKKEATPK